MDFYEGVVAEYLRADRSLFINTECCIQLYDGANPDTSGPHWYCDAVACDFRYRFIFLCEITYDFSTAALLKRLLGWQNNWEMIKNALQRDSNLPSDWPVRPWLFVPEAAIPQLLAKLGRILGDEPAFIPRITPLEMVQPWRYQSWRRLGEAEKPSIIPESMRL